MFIANVWNNWLDLFVRWELIGVISKHHLDRSNYGVYINEILPLGGPSIDSNTYMLFQDL